MKKYKAMLIYNRKHAIHCCPPTHMLKKKTDT